MGGSDMSDASAPVPGACLCREVQFEVRLPTLFCGHCHCSMCRRNHGAAYVTWFRLPKDQLRIVEGGSRLAVYQSSQHATRSFCSVCGSSLFFEIDDSPDTIDVVLANMDGAIDMAPVAHIHYDDAVAWVSMDDTLPRLGGEDGIQPLE